jgi:ABC-type transporter Mla subunit MlaD
MIRRIIAVGLVLATAIAAVVLTGARSTRETAGTKFYIAFDNAFGLTEGGDLRVGGVKAGTTKKFEVSKGRECQGREEEKDKPARTCAIVESEITEDGFKDFRTDANCNIRQQSLIGEYYVDCQPGHNEQPLASGSTIPTTQTTSTIPADLVGDVLRRPYRDRLRLIIAELGTGLAGRPQDIQELLQKAHPGLRETRKVLQILGDQRQIIRNFISDSNTVVRELDRNKRNVARFLVEASRTADVSASRRAEIAAGFERLPTFLDELDGTMVRLEELTDAQTPLLRNLDEASEPLDTFLTRLGPFTEASRPAFRSLGETSKVGSRAIVESREEITMLRKLARDAPSAGKPLRQFLQTMDNRDRATETNPDAFTLGPPAPDPAARERGKGFTGFEAFWRYWYWQALSLNQFDSVSHFLRAVGVEDPDCSPYLNDLRGPERGGSEEQVRIRERCNSYMGPNQPGITTDDPTLAGKTFAARTPAAKRGERRKAGEPEAGPLPGQVDYSQPQPSLSPSQQELLDSLTGDARSAVPQAPPTAPVLPGTSAGTSSVGQALDYLLGP